jgi:hypothetical protein
LSSDWKTHSKTYKLLVNLQLNIVDLGSTTIKGQCEMSGNAEVKTIKLLYEWEPPIVLEFTVGTVEHQQSLAAIQSSPHDWSHGAIKGEAFNVRMRGWWNYLPPCKIVMAKYNQRINLLFNQS